MLNCMPFDYTHLNPNWGTDGDFPGNCLIVRSWFAYWQLMKRSREWASVPSVFPCSVSKSSIASFNCLNDFIVESHSSIILPATQYWLKAQAPSQYFFSGSNWIWSKSYPRVTLPLSKVPAGANNYSWGSFFKLSLSCDKNLLWSKL